MLVKRASIDVGRRHEAVRVETIQTRVGAVVQLDVAAQVELVAIDGRRRNVVRASSSSSSSSSSSLLSSSSHLACVVERAGAATRHDGVRGDIQLARNLRVR